MGEGTKILKGAIILSFAGIVVKILGAVYRIPLYNIIGAEGMGLFQAAYPIYSIMRAIAVAGIPAAISKLVADHLTLGNYSDAKRIFSVSVVVIGVSSMVATLIVVLGARFYAEQIIQAPDVYYLLIAISPSIVLSAVKAPFRGFFQGQQNMFPTAISKIVEQLARIGAIIFFATVLVKQGVLYGAVGASIGTAFGPAVALAVLIVIYYRQKASFDMKIAAGGNSAIPLGKATRGIICLALPFAFTSSVLPMVNAIDSVVVLPRLQAAGVSLERALEQLGNLSGAAMPLIYLPGVIVTGLVVSLLPAISKAYTGNQLKLVAKLTEGGIKLGLLFSIPAAVGLFLLAEPISILFFNNIEIAYILQAATIIVPLFAFFQMTATALQGIGLTAIPVRGALIGITLKIILTYFLTSLASINVLGAVVGTVAFFGAAGLLNYFSLKRAINQGVFSCISLFKTLACAAIMGVVVCITSFVAGLVFTTTLDAERLIALIQVILGVTLGGLSYSIFTLISGTVSPQEIQMIPHIGKSVLNLLARLRLLKNN